MAGLLQIDFKIDKIIKRLQDEISDGKGGRLEYGVIVEIIEAQLRSTVDGIADGDTVVWKHFCSFFATRRRIDALNKKYESVGRKKTLEDFGMVRMSFKRDGTTGKTILFDHSKSSLKEVPYDHREDKDNA